MLLAGLKGADLYLFLSSIDAGRYGQTLVEAKGSLRFIMNGLDVFVRFTDTSYIALYIVIWI